MQTNYLTRDAILQSHDRPAEDVYIQAWGGYVRVRALSAITRDRIEGEVGMKSQWDNVRAKAAAEALVDGDNNPLFTQKDIGQLGKKSGQALDEIFSVVRRVSGMDEDATERAEKNSDNDHSDD